MFTDFCVVRHQKTNKIRYFVCNYNYCEFKCSVGPKMERHIKELHFDKNPIKCLECDALFWTFKLTADHIRPNHPNIFDESTQRFVCHLKDCNNPSFDRYSKLLIHRKRHTGDKPFKCSEKYPSCEWTFHTIGELK